MVLFPKKEHKTSVSAYTTLESSLVPDSLLWNNSWLSIGCPYFKTILEVWSWFSVVSNVVRSTGTYNQRQWDSGDVFLKEGWRTLSLSLYIERMKPRTRERSQRHLRAGELIVLHATHHYIIQWLISKENICVWIRNVLASTAHSSLETVGGKEGSDHCQCPQRHVYPSVQRFNDLIIQTHYREAPVNISSRIPFDHISGMRIAHEKVCSNTSQFNL